MAPPSNYLAARVRVGDILEVSAPRGSFVLQPGDRPIVLISAGIGVTPVLAMLHALAAEPSARQVWWLHGARSGNEHPFAEEARRLIRSLPHCRSYVQYSQPRREDRAGCALRCTWASRVSLLERLGVGQRLRIFICAGRPHFCGTLPRASPLGCRSRTSASQKSSARAKRAPPGIVQAPVRSPHPPAGVPGQGPRVSFARSGLDVNWDPAFNNLLELAEACDVPVQWSCRTGVCHTLRERSYHWAPSRYDPEPVEPPADGNLLTCCSRPQGDVIIDL